MSAKILATAAALIGSAIATKDIDKVYKHVALFSIDGAHASDIPKWIALSPNGAIASLVKTSFWYSGALSSAPSDSFPGIVNLIAGAEPRTSGVWYDDTWDRSFWPPFRDSGKHCDGPPGAEVIYDETVDYDSTKLWSGGIKPDNLPQAILNGKCQPIYPHQRIRVNTIFEVAHAAGKQTAWTDKHPSYDLVRGPSGKGLSVGYFPEIQSYDTTNVSQIITYDSLHVEAVLDWINATTPPNSEVQDRLTGIPALFGGNFQAVSVAQKNYGYVAGNLAFTPQLKTAFKFVDDSLGKIVSAIKHKGALDDTLVVVCSKHGQAPIDPTKLGKVNPALFSQVITEPIVQVTADDVALIFLAKGADTDAAVDQLNRNRDLLKIGDIISGKRLTYLGYGDPATDPAVPHIIVRPELSTIYTKSKSKIAEHGGLSQDDRNVACFISGTNIPYREYPHESSTAQIAPTILRALGLDLKALQGVVADHTNILSGFRG